MNDFPWDTPYKPTLKEKICNRIVSIKYVILNKLHHFVAHKLHANVCQNNVCFKIGERYRQNTQYTNEESNWVLLCEECRELNDEYWDDMWKDYNSGRL